MNEGQEKDLGLHPRPSGEYEPHSRPTTTDLEKDSLENGETAGFAPIRTRPASTATRNSRHGSALSRERSNNGYGVDDDDEDIGGDDGPDGAAPGVPPQEKDAYEVAWVDGDNDPHNPRSMPHWRKWSIVIITSIGSFCVTNASSIYTSTYTQMDAEFGNSRIVATLGLSFFVLGIAMGPFWSPLAEFYGRRPIYLASFAFFLIWLIPSAVAQNIQTMIIARFFQGLAGSAFLSVSGGTVSDLFARNQMQAAMAVFTLAPFAGPSMGPLIGGFINSNVSWRWTHYVLLIWAGVLLLTIYLFVPETYRE
jgi:multidrug resistance protein